MKILDCKLLSIEEARRVDTELKKAENGWGLRSPGNYGGFVAFVAGEDGYVYSNGSSVSLEFGVRPALYLESAISKSFKLASHNWINVFDNVYLCEDFIGKSVFNNNYSDGNNYEGSAVQKYVLSWFRSQGLEFNTEIEPDKDTKSTDNKIIEDFIYKVDESNKLEVQTEYNSIDEFFESSFQNDVKLDTLVIYTVDTKIPIIKLEKSKIAEKTNYRFIVDITLENGDIFMIKSSITTQEQLNQKLEQTIDALRNYPEFIKYIDDLENCL